MNETKNLRNKKIGKLIVLDEKPIRIKMSGHVRIFWKCKCECGKITIVRTDHLQSGNTVSCGCYGRNQLISRNKKRNGKYNSNWKGGKYKDKKGYIELLMPKHPNSSKKGRIMEHIYVMSSYLKRPLYPEETVHHINGIKDDNRIENLELWSSNHPTGQRVEDMINFCIDYLKKYKPEYLSILKQGANV